MRSDAEFEAWLAEVDQHWSRKFWRATLEIALLIVLFFAAVLAIIVVTPR
jgi:hypothetical protein